MAYDSLYGFRQRAHQYLGRAHDATFELIDAVLTTRHVYSFGEHPPLIQVMDGPARLVHCG